MVFDVVTTIVGFFCNSSLQLASPLRPGCVPTWAATQSSAVGCCARPVLGFVGRRWSKRSDLFSCSLCCYVSQIQHDRAVTVFYPPVKATLFLLMRNHKILSRRVLFWRLVSNRRWSFRWKTAPAAQLEEKQSWRMEVLLVYSLHESYLCHFRKDQKNPKQE